MKLCIGLDDSIIAERVVHETVDLVSYYKINLAAWLTDTRKMETLLTVLRDNGAYVILDGKFSDVPHMSAQYAEFAFRLFDAVTVNPWGGWESIKPFLERGRTFMWVLPSHLKRPDLGDLPSDWLPWLSDWQHDNLGWVIGANLPKAVLGWMRQTPYPVLVPGVGPQGGDLEKVLQCATDKDILTVSRLVEIEPRKTVTELLARMSQ